MKPKTTPSSPVVPLFSRPVALPTAPPVTVAPEMLAPSADLRARYPYLGEAVLRWVEWTPAMAADVLANHNAGNRPLTGANLDKLVRSVGEGVYGLSPDCIAIATTGRFVNGQHRLNMIVQTDKAQVIPTMYGVDESMFYLADDGRKRTNGERRATLHPDDDFDHKDWAAAATQLWYLAGHTNGAPSYAELEAVHATDPTSLEWAVRTLASHRAGVTAAIVAGFAYARPVAPEKVDDFAARLKSGANIPEASGLLYLKSTLDTINAQRGKRTGIVGLRGLPMLRLALKCLQAWIQDERVVLVRAKGGEVAHRWFQEKRAALGFGF